MHIVTLGDLMLDVLVDVPGGLRRDDDSEARIALSPGGQAANVAAWAVLLGARATVIGPLATGATADLLSAQLTAVGVDLVGIPAQDAGTVVSILDSGTRTMASDAGDQSWLSSLDVELLPADAEWLHLSSYPLLRTNDPSPAIRLAEHARRQGAGVSLDLSSAALIDAFGAADFVEVVARLRPSVVFANRGEWDAVGIRLGEATYDVVAVVKDGAAGVTVTGGAADTHHAAPLARVVDVTGAGDALAAGYLVGGVVVGLQTAARCVAQRGAQPGVSALPTR